MDRSDEKRVQVLRALEALRQGIDGGGELVVARVMTTQLCCLSGQATALDVVRTLQAKRFRHLLVTDDGGSLVGVISDRDVLACLGPHAADIQKLSQTLARDLMSTDLVTIGPQAPLTVAIGLLIEQGISCLPVVDGPRLIGILTNTDLHVLLQMLLQTLRLTGSEHPPAVAGR